MKFDCFLVVSSYLFNTSHFNFNYYLITVPLPCIVTDWTNWSAPDATGSRFRYRMMLRPALNGGKECPDLLQLGKGMLLFN